MASLEPQDALEQAVLGLLKTGGAEGGLGFTDAFAKQMFDGQPPPVCGAWFCSVWYDGQRTTGSAGTTALDEYHGVYVTVTVRLVQPFDRWLVHRRFLEKQVNLIRALLHKDKYNFVVCNAANVLAGYRNAGVPDAEHVVGFCESLRYAGLDAVQECGPEWLHAHIDQGDKNCAIAQRVKFVGARRIQNLANME